MVIFKSFLERKTRMKEKNKKGRKGNKREGGRKDDIKKVAEM